MADTKLQDENSLNPVTDKTRLYVEKETVDDNGIWQPFYTTIAVIKAFFANLFLKTDGTTTGATAQAQEFTNGTNSTIDEDNFYIQRSTAVHILNTTEDGAIDINTEGETYLKVGNAAGTIYSELHQDGTVTGLNLAHKNALATPADAIKVNGVKVYRALISQSGTSNPTAVVLENTLGEAPTFNYVDVGKYDMQTGGNIFTVDKTFITAGGFGRGEANEAIPDFTIKRFDAQNLRLCTSFFNEDVYTPGDDILVKTEIQILIYP